MTATATIDDKYLECERAIQRITSKYPDYNPKKTISVREIQTRSAVISIVSKCFIAITTLIVTYAFLSEINIAPTIAEIEAVIVYWVKMIVIVFSLVFGSYCPPPAI